MFVRTLPSLVCNAYSAYLVLILPVRRDSPLPFHCSLQSNGLSQRKLVKYNVKSSPPPPPPLAANPRQLCKQILPGLQESPLLFSLTPRLQQLWGRIFLKSGAFLFGLSLVFLRLSTGGWLGHSWLSGWLAALGPRPCCRLICLFVYCSHGEREQGRIPNASDPGSQVGLSSNTHTPLATPGMPVFHLGSLQGN